MFKLDFPIDLIDLDKDKEFAEHLEKEGTLLFSLLGKNLKV